MIIKPFIYYRPLFVLSKAKGYDACLACFNLLPFLFLVAFYSFAGLILSPLCLPHILLSPLVSYWLSPPVSLYSLHCFPTVCLASSCFPILYLELFPTVCLVYSLFYCLPCLSPPSSPYPTSPFLPALSSLSPYHLKSFLYVTHFVSANLPMSFHAHIVPLP